MSPPLSGVSGHGVSILGHSTTSALLTAKTAAASIIGTRLDYCNSLLFGSTEQNLDHLQRVQNNFAHSDLQAPLLACTTVLWHELHLLAEKQLIIFKLKTFTFKAKLRLPRYLGNLILNYQPASTLR